MNIEQMYAVTFWAAALVAGALAGAAPRPAAAQTTKLVYAWPVGSARAPCPCA